MNTPPRIDDMKRSSFFRGAPRSPSFLRAALATTGLGVATLASFQGCRSDAPPTEPPAATSSTTQHDRTREATISVETTASDGRVLSLVHTTSATTSPNGVETHLDVTLGGRPALSIVSSAASDGARRVTVEYGEGFEGVKRATYESADGKTFTGTVDGRAFAPGPIGSGAPAPAFADGRPAPTLSVDPVVRAALGEALDAVKRKASSHDASPATGSAPTPIPFAQPMFGVPGRFDDTQGTASCHGCIDAVYAGQVLCDIGAVAACWGSFGFGCGEAVAACVEEVTVGLTACHEPGALCCPVACGPTDFAGTVESCCYGGDTCLNPNTPGLCCAPGTQACGGKVCCTPDAPCQAEAGFCCPVQQTCGTGKDALCCDQGTACIGGQCCPADHVANDGTCCISPTLNGVCCDQFGEEACNGSCCTGTCCGGDVCCPTGQACTTAGGCCGAGQAACGALCCAAGQVCLDPSTSTCSSNQTVLEFWDPTTMTGTLGNTTCNGLPCETETLGSSFDLRGTGCAAGVVTITIPTPAGSSQTFTATADATGTFLTTVTPTGSTNGPPWPSAITATEVVNGTTYSANAIAAFISPTR